MSFRASLKLRWRGAMAAMGSPFGLSLPMPFTQSFKEIGLQPMLGGRRQLFC